MQNDAEGVSTSPPNCRTVGAERARERRRQVGPTSAKRQKGIEGQASRRGWDGWAISGPWTVVVVEVR